MLVERRIAQTPIGDPEDPEWDDEDPDDDDDSEEDEEDPIQLGTAVEAAPAWAGSHGIFCGASSLIDRAP